MYTTFVGTTKFWQRDFYFDAKVNTFETIVAGL